MADLFYPLQQFAEFAVSLLLGSSSGNLGESLSFFIYDSIKIIILLFAMVFAVGFLRTYLPQQKIRQWLGGKRAGVGNVIASAFGAITPFCSCSSIPIFIGFLKAGVPLGAAFSFLITSPLVNGYLVVLMWGIFGWKIAAAYVLSGMLIGVFSGIALGGMGLEKHLVKDIAAEGSGSAPRYGKISERLRFGFSEAKSILKKIWLWVVAGVGLGALIHGYLPQEVVHAVISAGGIFTVPAAVLIGIPLYANCVAVIPVAEALFQKGIPLGTALAFMMAAAALSLPEAVILRRAMNLRLIAVFFGVVALSIIITGYLFNFLQPFLV